MAKWLKLNTVQSTEEIYDLIENFQEVLETFGIIVEYNEAKALENNAEVFLTFEVNNND